MNAIILFLRLFDAQSMENALVGEHRVHAREFFHADFAATQSESESVVVLRFEVAHTGALKELIKTGLFQLACNPYRRDIAASHERLLRGDRAEELTVEILRREWAKRRRRIAQHRARMQH